MPDPKLQEILAKSEEEVWDVVRKTLPGSNCLKTHTAAAVVRCDEVEGIYRILSIGVNACAPTGKTYDSKLDACPRMDIKTGTNYGLCASLHAERSACLNIREGRTVKDEAVFASHLNAQESEILSAFTPEELKLLNGASLYLVGHYWSCESCVSFLKTVGITDIKLDKLTGGKTKSAYESKKIC